jgi:hypothetical protein
VRAAPTMKSKIIARVNPADVVHDDYYLGFDLEDSDVYKGLNKSWTHIDRVLRSSGDKKWQELRGWVAARFLEYFTYSDCNFDF